MWGPPQLFFLLALNLFVLDYNSSVAASTAWSGEGVVVCVLVYDSINQNFNPHCRGSPAGDTEASEEEEHSHGGGRGGKDAVGGLVSPPHPLSQTLTISRQLTAGRDCYLGTMTLDS